MGHQSHLSCVTTEIMSLEIVAGCSIFITNLTSSDTFFYFMHNDIKENNYLMLSLQNNSRFYMTCELDKISQPARFGQQVIVY